MRTHLIILAALATLLHLLIAVDFTTIIEKYYHVDGNNVMTSGENDVYINKMLTLEKSLRWLFHLTSIAFVAYAFHVYYRWQGRCRYLFFGVGLFAAIAYFFILLASNFHSASLM